MFTSIIGIILGYKSVLLPLLAAAIGWLLPSPLSKAIDGQAKNHDTEKNVSDHTAPTSDLDKLP